MLFMCAYMFPLRQNVPRVGQLKFDHFDPQRYRDGHWNLVQDLDAKHDWKNHWFSCQGAVFSKILQVSSFGDLPPIIV